MLPGMSGIEFLTIFMENPKHHQIPVIIWTGKELETEEIARLKHLDFQTVLKRDGGIRRLLEEIHEHLAVSSAKGSGGTNQYSG